MISYTKSSNLLEFIDSQRSLGKTIGFVPTMGALHLGHIALINAANKECDLVVCSIFVNPTQFNNESDLEKYPRTLEADKELLESFDCDILFNPSVEEMYPNGKTNDFEPPVTGNILNVLEGVHRPGHFEGMMQVVSLLLDKVNPTHLFMGLKDFQQYAICCKMVEAQGRAVEMRGISIVREESGLAMSSRNKRLSEEAKEEAVIIYESLALVKENLTSKSIAELEEMGVKNINKLKGTKIEYFEIVDQNTLMSSKSKENLIVLCAVWYEGVRLIDNMIL